MATQAIFLLQNVLPSSTDVWQMLLENRRLGVHSGMSSADNRCWVWCGVCRPSDDHRLVRRRGRLQIWRIQCPGEDGTSPPPLPWGVWRAPVPQQQEKDCLVINCVVTVSHHLQKCYVATTCKKTSITAHNRLRSFLQFSCNVVCDPD